jgi:hypothetical protein
VTLSLQTLDSGDTNYRSKHNSNYSAIQSAVNTLETAYASIAGVTGAIYLYRALFGTSAARIDESGLVASIVGNEVQLTAGYAWLPDAGAVRHNTATASTSQLNALGDGTYYVTLDSGGAPTASASSTDALYSVVKSGGSLGSLTTLAVTKANLGVPFSVAHGGTGAATFASNGVLYGAGTSAIAVTAAAASSVLVTSAGSVPSLSQTLPSAVQGNITALGTVTSGTWSATQFVDANISASAAIALSKLAALTASRLVSTDGSGVLQAHAAITASRIVSTDGSGMLQANGALTAGRIPVASAAGALADYAALTFDGTHLLVGDTAARYSTGTYDGMQFASSKAAILRIQGASGKQATLQLTAGTGASTGYIIGRDVGDNGTNDFFLFDWANNRFAMYVNSSGQIALGPSGGSASDSVHGWANTNGIAGFRFTNQSTGAGAYSTLYLGNATSQTDVIMFSVGTGNSAYGGARSGGIGTNTTAPFVQLINSVEVGRWTTAGLSMTGHITCAADNTYDLGASGATRPRRVYVGTEVVVPTLTASTTVATAGITVSKAVSGAGLIATVQNTTATAPAELQIENSTTYLQIGIEGNTLGTRLGGTIANAGYLGVYSNAPLTLHTNNLYRGQISGAGSWVVGAASALATNASDGFLYVPSCAGTPSGTPTAYTGKVALVYDTTGEKLWAYNGAWKSVTLA